VEQAHRKPNINIIKKAILTFLISLPLCINCYLNYRPEAPKNKG